MNYLAMDRLDIQFQVGALCRDMAKPNQSRRKKMQGGQVLDEAPRDDLHVKERAGSRSSGVAHLLGVGVGWMP